MRWGTGWLSVLKRVRPVSHSFRSGITGSARNASVMVGSVIPDLKLCDTGLTRFNADSHPVPQRIEG